MRDVIRKIGKLLRLMVGRGIVRWVNDGPGLQETQVELFKNDLGTYERFQDYGISSVPLPGAEAILVAVGGARTRSVVVRVDDRRHRVKLAQGEVALYTHEGTLIVLRNGGTVEIVAATKVKSKAPLWEHDGDVAVSGSITAQGQISSAVQVLAPVMNAATSLVVNGIEMKDHNHHYTWTDPAGNGYTAGPSAP